MTTFYDSWRDAIYNKLFGSIDVNVQDQTSPALIFPANKVNNTTTTSSAVAIGDTTVDVTSTTGFVDGAFIVITDTTSNRYYKAHQVGAISGSTVTLDTPLDFAFPSGAQITNGVTDLAVNGSVTPQTFSLRAAEPAGGLNVSIDITKVIFDCIATSAVDLSKFGNLTALTNGLVCRRVDGTYYNIFNVKDNADIDSITGTWTPYAATNPAQGVDGFRAVLTFGGQGNVGVVQRVGSGEDLEFIVQDNLSTLTSLRIIIIGHQVVD